MAKRPPPAGRKGRPAAGRNARAQEAARQRQQQRRTPPGRGKKPRRSRWKTAGIWTLRVIFYGTLFAICAVIGGVYAATPTLPRIENSSAFHQRTGAIYARDGRTRLRELRAPTSRHYVREEDIPPLVAAAAVAAEDRRFYEHGGLDPRGIVRAVVVDARTHSAAQGASTITQQLVKNTYVGPDRTVGRKTREALLALALDSRWSKQRILTAYLNTAYFGQGAYGVADGARTWFGKRLPNLTPAQAALLAGLLQSPEGSNPLTDPKGITARRNEIIEQMYASDAITETQRDAALKTPIPSSTTLRARQHGGDELAPHFTDDVIGHLVAKFGTARALGSGMKVTTTLDARMQRAARRAVTDVNGTGLSAALVSIDVRSGQVRAMALGGPAAKQAFNVATLGHRQPGSAFKPFTLAAALEQGYTAATVVKSAPFEQKIGAEVWKVKNAEATYAGSERLDRATWHSDNTVYARVASAIGIDKVIDAARRAGITSRIDNVPSTVLGALPDGVTPMEIAAAYATFPRGGMTIPTQFGGSPVSVREAIEPGAGRVMVAPSAGAKARAAAAASAQNTLDTTSTQPDSTDAAATDASATGGDERAFSAAVASEVTNVLRGVVTQGTGRRASIGRPAAGKTGTTDRYVDAWFVGYTPELVTAVWVGNPSGAVPMRTQWGGGPVFGGTFPAEIWARFMGAALAGRTVSEFPMVHIKRVTVTIDPATGLLADEWCAGATRESFIAGTEPTKMSTTCASKVVAMPNLMGLTLAAAKAKLDKLGITPEVHQLGVSPSGTDVIVSQTPSAGGGITRGSVVKLYTGPATAAPGGATTVPGTVTSEPPGSTTGTTGTTGTTTATTPTLPKLPTAPGR